MRIQRFLIASLAASMAVIPAASLASDSDTGMNLTSVGTQAVSIDSDGNLTLSTIDSMGNHYNEQALALIGDTNIVQGLTIQPMPDTPKDDKLIELQEPPKDEVAPKKKSKGGGEFGILGAVAGVGMLAGGIGGGGSGGGGGAGTIGGGGTATGGGNSDRGPAPVPAQRFARSALAPSRCCVARKDSYYFLSTAGR